MAFTSFEDRARINRVMKRIGLGGFEDSNLIPQVGFCIQDHDHFRNVLLAVEPHQRRIAYQSLRPHLTFPAKPLDVYEAEGKRLAEEQQLPIWDGSAYPKAFDSEARLTELARAALQQNAHEKAKGVLELVCTKCTVAGRFPSATRQQSVKDAHAAGWRSAERNGSMKTYCPAHVPGRCTMKIECNAQKLDLMNPGETIPCGKKELFRVWDEQDGYAMARRLGWEFTDSETKCPRCAVKLVIQ